MANGSDGSIVIDTELDQSGFEQGSNKLLSSVKDLTSAVDNLGDNMMASFQAVIPVLQDIAANTSQIYSAMTTQGQQAVDTNNEVAASEENAAQAAQGAAQAAQQQTQAVQGAGEAARDATGAVQGAGEAVEQTMNTSAASASKLQTQLNTVNRQIEDMEAKIAAGEAAKMPYVDQAEELRAKIKEAEAEAQRFGQAWAAGVPGADRDQAGAQDKVAALKAEYAAVVAEIDKMDRPLSRNYDKLDALRQRAGELKTQLDAANLNGNLAASAEVANERIAAMSDELRECVARQKELQAGGVGAGYAEYDQLTARIAQLQAEIKEYNNTLTQAQARTGFFSSVLSGLAGALRAAGAAALSAAGHLAKVGAQAVAKQVQKVTSKIKELAHSNKQATLTSNGLVKALTSIKTMLKSQIKRMFISYLMSEIKSAMPALVQYSSAFNTAVSGMRNGASELAANIGVAFSNLVNAIAPAITAIINLLSQAMSYLNAFFAMLGGKSTVTVAKKQTDDYAKSLGGAAGAAKDLDKANKTLGIDELNVVSSDDSGGGGGGGGGGAKDLYEDVSIDSLLPEDVSNWFERIKAAFEAGDWYGIGNIISEGLNAAMGVVDGWINGTLHPLATTWASRIAQLLNGMVDGFDWTLMGKTLADGVNTVFDTLNTFLTTFNFDNLGAGIGSAINGLFSNIDWTLVGSTFANKWNALIDTLHGIVTTTDWGMVGKSVGTGISSFLTGIDWGKMGTTLVKGFNGVVKFLRDGIASIDWWGIGSGVATGIQNALLNIDWAAIGQTLSNGIIGLGSMIVGFVSQIDWTNLGRNLVDGIGNAIKNVDWMGVVATLGTVAVSIVGGLVDLILGALAGIVDLLADAFSALGLDGIAGFLRGLAEGIAGVGAWIKTNIIDPVVNWFKDLLGIHSPSTVFAEIGGFLIQGLLQGISNVWTGITSFFSGAIAGLKATLSNAWTNIRTTASTAWNNLKTSVTTTFENAKTALSNTAENVKTTLSNAWESVKTTASTKWSEFKTKVSTTFENTKTALSTTAENLKTTLSTAWDSIKTTASTKWTNLKTTVGQKFTELKSNVSTTTENLKTTLSTAWDSIKTTATTKWAGLKSKVLELWNRLKTDVGKVDWKDIGTNLVEGVKQGISNAWAAFKKWVTDTFNSVTSAVKAAFGIKSPSRVFAEIGEYLDEGLVVGLKAGQGDMLSTVKNIAGSVTDTMNDAHPELEIATNATVSNLEAVAGILSNIAQTFATITSVLTSMGGLQVPAIAAGRVVPYQTRVASDGPGAGTDALTTAMLTGNAEVIAVLREMLDRLERAIENSGGDLYIGDEQVVRSYERGSNARGVVVSRGAFANAY